MESVFKRYLGSDFGDGARQEFSKMVYRGLTDEDIKRKYPSLTYDSINIMRVALISTEQNARISQFVNQNVEANFNVVGEFKAADIDGTVIIYTKGDVVYYENKTYIATRTTSGYSPRHENGGWKPVTLQNVIDGDTF